MRIRMRGTTTIGCSGGGGIRTPVLTGHPAASTSLVDVLGVPMRTGVSTNGSAPYPTLMSRNAVGIHPGKPLLLQAPVGYELHRADLYVHPALGSESVCFVRDVFVFFLGI